MTAHAPSARSWRRHPVRARVDVLATRMGRALERVPRVVKMGADSDLVDAAALLCLQLETFAMSFGWRTDHAHALRAPLTLDAARDALAAVTAMHAEILARTPLDPAARTDLDRAALDQADSLDELGGLLEGWIERLTTAEPVALVALIDFISALLDDTQSVETAPTAYEVSPPPWRDVVTGTRAPRAPSDPRLIAA